MLEILKQKENYVPDIVVRMMPTTSKNTDDIDAIIEILINDKKADSAVVISKQDNIPKKALKIINEIDGNKKLVTYFYESGR